MIHRFPFATFVRWARVDTATIVHEISPEGCRRTQKKNTSFLELCSRILVASPWCLLFVWCFFPLKIKSWNILRSIFIQLPCSLYPQCRHEVLKFQYPYSHGTMISWQPQPPFYCVGFNLYSFHYCSLLRFAWFGLPKWWWKILVIYQIIVESLKRITWKKLQKKTRLL